MMFYGVLAVFLLAVYGLANAIAMLKIGCYFFGDLADEILLVNGKRIAWKKLSEKGGVFEGEDCNGSKFEFKRPEIKRVLKRKGLGRIPYIGDVFYCPACLSFWIGMAMSWWILSPAAQVCPVRWQAMLIDGLMACGVSSFLHAIVLKLTHGIEEG